MPDDDTAQLRFEDGDLVRGDPGVEARAADPVEPGEATGFALEVRDGALEVNDPLRAAVDEHGRVLTFAARARAEAYARRLSTRDGALRVQAAPANDARGVDAYLLAAHDPAIAEPASVDGDAWTFDVGANLYGALGEAVLLHAPKPHALHYFVRRDLEAAEDDLRVAVDPGSPLAVDTGDGQRRWTPDCVVTARDAATGDLLETYYCEVKAGNGSFERDQGRAMAALAGSARVLKVRVNVEELPEQYALRVTEVDPA